MTIDLTELKADPYWSNITNIAQANNQPIEVLEAELISIYEDPKLQNALKGIPAGLPRLKQVAGIIMARQSKELIVKVEPYTIRVLTIEAPKVIIKKDKSKMRLASILGFAQSKKPGAKMALAQVTFYEKNADLLADVKEGAVYDLLLSGSFKDGSYKLTGDHRTSFKNPVEVKDDSPWGLPINDVISRIYPRIPMSQLKTKVGKFVQVQGTVVMSMTRPNKKGGTFGRYTLIDESLTADAIQKGGAISVMCSAEQVKYGPDSQIIVLGNVTNSPEYGLGLGGFNVVVIPIIAFPRETAEEANGEASGPAVDFSEFADDEDQASQKPADAPAGEFE